MDGVGSGRQEVAHTHVERLGDLFQGAERGRLQQIEEAAQVRAPDAGVVGQPILLPPETLHVLADGRRHVAVELGSHTGTILTSRAKRFPIGQLLSKAMPVILLICAAPAAADKDRARQLFEEGSRRYNLGEYPAALGRFKAAYEEFPEPTLLYNTAQCYRQLGDKAQAVTLYRSYLREVPDAANGDEVRRVIVALDSELLREQIGRASWRG